jgi:hypothetical protein
MKIEAIENLIWAPLNKNLFYYFSPSVWSTLQGLLNSTGRSLPLNPHMFFNHSYLQR